MDLSIRYKGRAYKIKARSLGFLSRFRGLMFRKSKTENLLFDFGRDVKFSIHSFFVFFPFLAIWLDYKDRVIECRIVKPFLFGIKPRRKFRRLIEIPLKLNSKNIEQVLKNASK